MASVLSDAAAQDDASPEPLLNAGVMIEAASILKKLASSPAMRDSGGLEAAARLLSTSDAALLPSLLLTLLGVPRRAS